MASPALAVLFLAMVSRDRKKTSDSQRQVATERWNRAALFLSSCVRLGTELGNHRGTTRADSVIFCTFEFTKWLCVCSRLLSAIWALPCPVTGFLTHHTSAISLRVSLLFPSLAASADSAQTNTSSRQPEMLRQLKNHQQPTKKDVTAFFFWWQVGFPEKRPFIVVVAITWIDKSLKSISLRFRDARNIITCFVRLLIVWQGRDRCHILSKAYKKLLCLSCFRLESSNRTP